MFVCLFVWFLDFLLYLHFLSSYQFEIHATCQTIPMIDECCFIYIFFLYFWYKNKQASCQLLNDEKLGQMVLKWLPWIKKSPLGQHFTNTLFCQFRLDNFFKITNIQRYLSVLSISWQLYLDRLTLLRENVKFCFELFHCLL